MSTDDVTRASDPSRTLHGPANTWPARLHFAVDSCLSSKLAELVSWGPERLCIYNDAFAALLGLPPAEPFRTALPSIWSDAWTTMKETVDEVLTSGRSAVQEGIALPGNAGDGRRPGHVVCAYNPLRSEEGEIGGLSITCLDDSRRALGERGRDDAIARTILESITDAFFALDARWLFTYVNKRASSLLGIPVEELLGRAIWEVLPGLLGSELERMYRSTVADGVARSVTEYYADHDRYYEAHAYPGALEGISVYFRDVTVATRAATSLRDRTALLNAISDSTGDVIFAKDREGRMRFANPAALSLIGKPLDQVLGKTDAEFLQEKSSAAAVMENDRRIMQTGVAADVEEIVPLPDGTRRIWLSRKMPDRDEAGNVIGILGVSRDITVQTRASERARRLYDVAAALSLAVTPDDVARVTIDQGILAVGATAGSLAFVTADGAHLELAGWVGYAPEVMQRWRRFSLDADVPLAEAVRTGQPVYVQSAEERSTRYPALTTLTATKGTKSSACIPLLTGGRCVGALGLSFDRAGVSALSEDRELLLSLGRQCAQALERARLFEAERHARVEAEHAGRMKDEFLTTLSHELRTPLNAIVGWATLLASNPTDAGKVLHGLATIQRNAKAQTQIIEDLLDMSAIISGKVRLDVQRMDLADVLQAAADTVRPAAEAKGIRLRTLLDSDTGPMRGDPSRLQQVFWNLLTNAVKFTGRGGQVEMVLQRVHSHIEITVADTGEGIPSDFIPFVFDRFRQADATITRRHGGLGLGLALVKQLTELHGGSVRVESPGAGLGTTFTVRLPLSIAHEAPPPAPAPPPALQKTANDAALGSPHRRLQGLSILVVDDEPDARDLLEELLTESGAVVRTAASAASALTSLESDWPEVLISDIGMPDEDGYSLVARLRALEAADGSRGPRIAALALTAYARSEDRMKALRSGFDMHVAKPIDPEELLIVIVSLARRTSVNPSA
jgi:PAS domain S-box-containing protein